MKKKREGTVTISFSNKWLYIFIVLLVLVVGGVMVYAYGTSNPQIFGHSIGELAPPSPCIAGQFLEWNGATWTCGG